MPLRHGAAAPTRLLRVATMPALRATPYAYADAAITYAAMHAYAMMPLRRRY